MKIKELIHQLKCFYHKGNNQFYFSLIGPFVMGTIHLIFTIIHFDWIVLNYCIFSYLMCLSRFGQFLVYQDKLKISHLLLGAISLLIVIAPMMASFILTIRYKETPHYLFDWLIYAYALYGTIKMVFAIKTLTKKEKDDHQYVLSFFGLTSALYTIQMMEFHLIKFASSGEDESMYLMQLFSQGAIFLFTSFVIGLFIYKHIKQRRKVI